MGVEGKSNTLEYIAKSLPHIPIGPFERIRNDFWSFFTLDNPGLSKAKKIARELGYPVIIRSDGKEDRLGASFAGLFYSVPCSSEEHLRKSLHIARYDFDEEVVRRYSQTRNVKMPSAPLDVMIQKYSESKIRAIITRHPHQEGTFFVDLEWEFAKEYPYHAAFVIGKDSIDKLFDGKRAFAGIENLSTNEVTKIRDDVGVALKNFEDAENLPGFDRGVSYQNEIGLLPYSFFQWRSFRRREFASFNIDDVAPPPDDKRVYSAPTVFGITTEEGVSVILHDGPHIGTIRRSKSPKVEDDYVLRYSATDRFLNENFKREFSIINDGTDRLRSDGLSVGLSFDRPIMQSHVPDYYLRNLPDVTIFSSGQYSVFPWQAHDSFRYLERGSLVAISDMPISRKVKNELVCYWSNGIQGRIMFLGKI